MNPSVAVALYAFVPLVAVLFAYLPASRAALASYLVGWLFLPVVDTEVFGFFDLSKGTAVPLIVFAAMLAFDSQRVFRFRLSLVDLPVAVFCLVPMASSVSNDLGTHDAFAAPMYQTIRWGLPYFTGRVYFSSVQGFQQIARGVLAGALIYVPLCLWEIRMSPQLHATLYGSHQHNFDQTLRGGGYRPMVFLDHGLMLGLWMGAASLIGLVLWRSGTLKKIGGIPVSLAVPVLVVTFVLCKSFGALVLFLIGMLVLWSARGWRSSLPMALLVCIPPAYVATRTVVGWSGSNLTALVAEVDQDRAQSLAFRMEAEEALRVKAAEQPLLGWGGFGRSFVRRFEDVRRSDTVVTDSLWIIVFGKYGFVGLAALLSSFLVPIVVLWRRCPPRTWWRPDAACAWALATVLTLYALDSLVNAMVNPLYFVIAGAVGGLALAPVRVPESRASARALSPASVA
jgi:hypothetical protein